MNSLDLQGRATEWALKTFGRVAMDVRERALRLVEEAIEMSQAVGVERYQVLRMVWEVYSRKPGNPKSEMGGVAITSMIMAEALELNFLGAAEKEYERLKTPQTIARCKKRQAEKKKKGLAADSPEDEEE